MSESRAKKLNHDVNRPHVSAIEESETKNDGSKSVCDVKTSTPTKAHNKTVASWDVSAIRNASGSNHQASKQSLIKTASKPKHKIKATPEEQKIWKQNIMLLALLREKEVEEKLEKAQKNAQKQLKMEDDLLHAKKKKLEAIESENEKVKLLKERTEIEEREAAKLAQFDDTLELTNYLEKVCKVIEYSHNILEVKNVDSISEEKLGKVVDSVNDKMRLLAKDTSPKNSAVVNTLGTLTNFNQNLKEARSSYAKCEKKLSEVDILVKHEASMKATIHRNLQHTRRAGKRIPKRKRSFDYEDVIVRKLKHRIPSGLEKLSREIIQKEHVRRNARRSRNKNRLSRIRRSIIDDNTTASDNSENTALFNEINWEENIEVDTSSLLDEFAPRPPVTSPGSDSHESLNVTESEVKEVVPVAKPKTENTTMQEKGNIGFEFTPGCHIHVMDYTTTSWLEGTIAEVDWEEEEVLVHYNSSKSDEWVSMNSQRLSKTVTQPTKSITQLSCDFRTTKTF
ncbi:hypothetical protein AAG570_000352 [Ranatra chinensis]|uniref:Uncharacterized protein n=1 Tax=Ranatra chinensis TaxID=642074 RepID=A0ABD0YWT4_9HEMI